jgi:hypothetical protein
MKKLDALRAILVAGLYVVGSTGLGSLWTRAAHFAHSGAVLPPVWMDAAIVVAAFPAAIGAGVAFTSLRGRAVVVALALSPFLTTGVRLALDEPGQAWVLENAMELMGASALSGLACVLGYLAVRRWRTQ